MKHPLENLQILGHVRWELHTILKHKNKNQRDLACLEHISTRNKTTDKIQNGSKNSSISYTPFPSHATRKTTIEMRKEWGSSSFGYMGK